MYLMAVVSIYLSFEATTTTLNITVRATMTNLELQTQISIQ
jgi:hypothetical protein